MNATRRPEIETNKHLDYVYRECRKLNTYEYRPSLHNVYVV